MSELNIELISERCKECPRLELETVSLMGQTHHRCRNLQLCREVLGYWKQNNRIEELQITEYKEEKNGKNNR